MYHAVSQQTIKALSYLFYWEGFDDAVRQCGTVSSAEIVFATASSIPREAKDQSVSTRKVALPQGNDGRWVIICYTPAVTGIH